MEFVPVVLGVLGHRQMGPLLQLLQQRERRRVARARLLAQNAAAAAAAAAAAQVRRRRAPVVWVAEYITCRSQYGQYHQLVQWLMDDTIPTHTQRFKLYMGMDCAMFRQICNDVGPHVQKQDTKFRDCICPGN